MGLAKRISGVRGKGFDFSIDNSDLNDLKLKLEKIPREIQQKVAAKAFRYAGIPFINEARNNATSDRVAKGIHGIMRTYRGVKGYLMGPSPGIPSPFWLEYGTLSRYEGGWGSRKHKPSYTVKETYQFYSDKLDRWVTVKSGTVISTGVQARPFMRPAWDHNYKTMVKRMGEKIGKEVIKIAKTG